MAPTFSPVTACASVGTDFDRQLSLGVVMPLFGFGSPMKRAGLDVPSSYFHDLATWSNINRMYEPRVIADIRSVRQEASEPALLDRLIQVVDEQRGHTLAMEVEDAKIALSDKRQADIPLEWIEPGLHAGISRPDLVSHTRQLAERIAARIKNCLAQARLSAGDIDAVFLTGGSVKLAHVRKAITKAVPAARIVEGDISAPSARASRWRRCAAMDRMASPTTPRPEPAFAAPAASSDRQRPACSRR